MHLTKMHIHCIYPSLVKRNSGYVVTKLFQIRTVLKVLKKFKSKQIAIKEDE